MVIKGQLLVCIQSGQIVDAAPAVEFAVCRKIGGVAGKDCVLRSLHKGSQTTIANYVLIGLEHIAVEGLGKELENGGPLTGQPAQLAGSAHPGIVVILGSLLFEGKSLAGAADQAGRDPAAVEVQDQILALQIVKNTVVVLVLGPHRIESDGLGDGVGSGEQLYGQSVAAGVGAALDILVRGDAKQNNILVRIAELGCQAGFDGGPGDHRVLFEAVFKGHAGRPGTLGGILDSRGIVLAAVGINGTDHIFPGRGVQIVGNVIVVLVVGPHGVEGRAAGSLGDQIRLDVGGGYGSAAVNGNPLGQGVAVAVDLADHAIRFGHADQDHLAVFNCGCNEEVGDLIDRNHRLSDGTGHKGLVGGLELIGGHCGGVDGAAVGIHGDQCGFCLPPGGKGQVLGDLGHLGRISIPVLELIDDLAVTEIVDQISVERGNCSAFGLRHRVDLVRKERAVLAVGVANQPVVAVLVVGDAAVI